MLTKVLFVFKIKTELHKKYKKNSVHKNTNPVVHLFVTFFFKTKKKSLGLVASGHM